MRIRVLFKHDHTRMHIHTLHALYSSTQNMMTRVCLSSYLYNAPVEETIDGRRREGRTVPHRPTPRGGGTGVCVCVFVCVVIVRVKKRRTACSTSL